MARRFSVSSQLSVFGRRAGRFEDREPRAENLSSVRRRAGLAAALARRNRAAVRAGLGMSQERADARRRLGRQDVLELARLLLDLGLALDVQRLGKQALGEPVTADHVGCPLTPARGELHEL